MLLYFSVAGKHAVENAWNSILCVALLVLFMPVSVYL
jgi:hypothetical protein